LPLLSELPDPTERQAAYDTVTSAQQHIMREDYEPAIALLEPLLVENPANHWARSFLAGSLRELGRTEEAITQFTLLTRQQPHRLEPHWSLARLLRQANQFEEAIDHYLQAVRCAPGNLPLLLEAIRPCWMGKVTTTGSSRCWTRRVSGQAGVRRNKRRYRRGTSRCICRGERAPPADPMWTERGRWPIVKN